MHSKSEASSRAKSWSRRRPHYKRAFTFRIHCLDIPWCFVSPMRDSNVPLSIPSYVLFYFLSLGLFSLTLAYHLQFFSAISSSLACRPSLLDISENRCFVFSCYTNAHSNSSVPTLPPSSVALKDVDDNTIVTLVIVTRQEKNQ